MVRISTVLCAALFLSTPGFSQESPEAGLAVLPPMPNLYLGDPERPLSRKMRRALAREEERKQRMAEMEKREMEERKAAVRFEMTGERVEEKKLFDNNGLLGQRRSNRPVTNSISSLENATTADGTRLKPFGDDDYWGGIDESTEDPLVELPPMPDLRTPDQVTRKERKRNKLVTRQAVRKATAEAKRENREQKQNVVVMRPESDPDLALVKVRSERGAPSAGMVEAPETIRDSDLKPFNEDSTYYRNGFLVFRGDEKRGNPDGRFRLFKKNEE